MINRPTESELLKLAHIEIDKNMPLEERVVYMHFFLDGHDWYVSQYDPQTRCFFGYMIPGDDYQQARWDYFNFDMLDRMRIKAHREVVRNTHWQPKRAIEIDRIRDAYTWQKNLKNSLKRAKQEITRDKNP